MAETKQKTSYLGNFKVKKVSKVKDSEGKEEKILLYLESNDINIVNSSNQIIVISDTKIRKN